MTLFCRGFRDVALIFARSRALGYERLGRLAFHIVKRRQSEIVVCVPRRKGTMCCAGHLRRVDGPLKAIGHAHEGHRRGAQAAIVGLDQHIARQY